MDTAKNSANVFEEIEKPRGNEFVGDAEGRCPICRRAMTWKRISLSDGKRFYKYDFTIYKCEKHFHGYFRWLGNEEGHVLVKFPQIFGIGKDDGPASEINKDDAEMVPIICPACGFRWKELKQPSHERVVCWSCGQPTNWPTYRDYDEPRQKRLDDF